MPIFDGPMAQLGESGTYAGFVFFDGSHYRFWQIKREFASQFKRSEYKLQLYFSFCYSRSLGDCFIKHQNVSELFVACLKNFGVLCIGLYRYIVPSNAQLKNQITSLVLVFTGSPIKSYRLKTTSWTYMLLLFFFVWTGCHNSRKRKWSFISENFQK